MRKTVKVTISFILFLLITGASFSYADLCPIPQEEGKWGAGTYMGTPNALYKLSLKTSCEAIYENECGYETCYNSLWDSIFGTGHKCNEFCTRKYVKTVITYDGAITYSTFNVGHLNNTKVKGQYFNSTGWFRFDVDKSNDQDKNFYRFWAKILSDNNNKITFIREEVKDGKVIAQNSHTLNKL